MEKGQPFISSFPGQKARLPKSLFGLLLLILLPFFAWGQNSFPATDTLQASGDTLKFGHGYLLPHSLSLRTADGAPVDTSQFNLNWIAGTAVLKDSSLKNQPILATYRYFPRFLNTEYAFRTFELKVDKKGDTLVNVISPRYYKEFEEVVELGNLRKSGSISRGITVGNRQSVTVTSGLRLQVEGEIADDIKVLAAITDENIPIQPDGTTQQISDFDKVYVQLIKGRNDVLLGDFEINHRGTYFANFYRNVQGIGIHVNTDNISASANGAVAKGRFNTNSINGLNGVQGPYRLTGKNNERFIIVLAGSEKVYLNGDLMTRGEGNDYTIDYNTGEVYFTSQRIITNVSRIVVDFEYTDRFYNRSLLFANLDSKFANDKVNFRFSYGRDADNQNQPIDLSFGDDDRDTLQSIGDDNLRAVSSGIDTVEFTPDAILYARNDTFVGGFSYERYQYSSDPNAAIYDLTFSFVGSGNGFYVKSDRAVNGTTFDWVPPDTLGNPTGDYAPVKLLSLPQLLQVADMKLDVALGKHTKVYTELAVSSLDKNRFSPFDDDDNTDLANKTGIVFDRIRVGDSTFLKVDLSNKYVGQRYTNLDRINKVEYGREWNFDDLGEQLTENVSEATVELRVKRDLTLLANAGYRLNGNLTSIKQLYEAKSKSKIVQGKHRFTTISTRNNENGSLSRWDRHNGDIYKRIGKIQPGVEIWIEDKKNQQNDSLGLGSFRFYDLKPYVKLVQMEKLDLTLSYNYRQDFEFLDSVMREKAIAHTEYLKLIWRPWNNLTLQNTSSLRDFQVQDTAFLATGAADSRTLITNLQGTYFTKNRLVYSNLLYEVTSEQLARRDIAYIQVNPGLGQYIWQDKDGDEQQDLDEFLPTTDPTLSPNFIQVIVPTRELLPTTSLNFAGNFKLDFKRTIKRSRSFFPELLRNFSSITNFRVRQKKEAGNQLDNFLIDFSNLFGDTTLLDAQYTFKEDAYFFRNHPVGDVRLSWVDNQSKLFLSIGDELRRNKFFSSEQRLNLGKSKSIENQVKFGRKFTVSERLEERNFDIDFFEIEPKMNFQLSRKFRFSVGYTFKDKLNTGSPDLGDNRVRIHKLGTDAKWNLKGRNNIFAKLELVHVSETGQSNFAADYELKESLQTGVNALWQLFSTIYISKTLELSVTYDGRASENLPVTHTGRVQLKAFF